MTAKAPPGLISTKQVVNLVGPSFWRRDEMIDEEDIDRWIKRGWFPPPEFRMGGTPYWRRDEVKRWLKNPPADCRARIRIDAAFHVRTGGAK